ncbi:MAG: hypothetical protein ABI119_01140, partial [Gemmatimonadaceae bacterium]
EGKHKHHKHGHYNAKNENYKNGYYRHGRGHDDYDNDRDNNRSNNRDNNTRYPNQYPSRGAARYPSSIGVPGFPNVNVPNGRAGKTLPGTGQQQQNYNRHRGN